MSKNNKLSKVAYFLGLTMAIGGVNNVGAQSQDQDTNLVLEELIVTARKVEESIQDIPVAITAFSAEQLKKRSVEQLEDIALQTPGLTFEDFSNGGFGTPVIRGASQFNIDALEQNVSTFFDGVYIPRNYALDLGVGSLERVEVVKGPQSSLYGANSFLGAINYVTAKPDLEVLAGNVEVTIGDDGREDIGAEVSFPLITDKLAIKVGVNSSEYDGDFLNSHPAANDGPSLGTDDSIGGWDKDTYSVSLLAKPNENLNIELAYHNFDVFTETRAQTRLQVGDLNCGGTIFGGPQRGFCGELPGTPLEFGTDTATGFLIDPRTFGLDAETEILRAAISGNLTENLSLSYQFANIEGEVFSAGNSDRSPLIGSFDAFGTQTVLNAFSITPVGGFDYDSHELRLEFNGDNGLYAMVGAFYSDGSDITNSINGGVGAFFPLFGDSLAPITEDVFSAAGVITENIIETETTAIFARIETPIFNENLTLSIEGRYTDETKETNIVYNDGTSSQPRDEDYFTPRVSLDYKLNDNTLIYASYAEGVKAGGFNDEIGGGLLVEEREFDEDENETIEIGFKSTLLNGAMQLNATAYYIDWSNLQVTEAATNGGFFTTSITGNLGDATSTGFEADLTYAITSSLTFNAGLALNDATYSSGTISQRLDRSNICDDVVCSADGDISGNDLPRSSDTQWNIGLQYDGALTSDFNYFLRADYVGQSDQFISEANIGTIPSRELLNLRAGINNEKWSAELWITNATDELYVANAFYIPSPFFVAIVPTFGNQRRIGANISYSF